MEQTLEVQQQAQPDAFLDASIAGEFYFWDDLITSAWVQPPFL